jgi:hypothetical protein
MAPLLRVARHYPMVSSLGVAGPGQWGPLAEAAMRILG